VNQTVERGPDCWQCRFFSITHIPATPYACTRMGFRSAGLPSIEVLRADGRFCQGFEPKGPRPSAKMTASSARTV